MEPSEHLMPNQPTLQKLSLFEIDRLIFTKMSSKESLYEYFSDKNLIRNTLISLDFNRLKMLFNKRELEIDEFVETVYSVIKLPPNQQIYAIIGIVELFENIATENKGRKKSSFKPFIDYVIDNFAKSDNCTAKLTLLNSKTVANLPHVKKSDLAFMNSQFAEIQKENNDFQFKINVHSSKTNSNSFSTSVNISLYDPTSQTFYIVLEGVLKVYLFDGNCNCITHLIPKNASNVKEINFLSLALSDKTNKLAALMTDDTISFWDISDNYFEINLNFYKHTKAKQRHLFFSTIFQAFVTVETPICLNLWNLNNGTIQETIKVCQHTNSKEEIVLRSVTELKDLEMFLIISEQNEVILFDSNKNQINLQKTLKMNKLIQVIYSYKSQALIFICNDYNINVLKLEYQKSSYEINYVGKLLGHLHLVRCGCLIDTRDILLSIDEGSVIKLWDLYSMKCIQSVQLQKLSFIRSVYFMPKNGNIIIMSKKVNQYRLQISQHTELNEDNTIQSIYFDPIRIRFVVFRKFDCVFVNAQTGRPTLITSTDLFSKIKKKIQTESVRVVRNGGQFLIGDADGHVHFVDYKLSQINQPIKTTGAVKFIFFDKKFGLHVIISSNSISLNRLANNSLKDNCSLLRRISFGLDDKISLKIVRIKMKLNLLLFVGNLNILYFVNYEYFKIPLQVQFDENIPIIDLAIIGSLGIAIVIMKNGMVQFLEIEINDSLPNFSFKLNDIGCFHSGVSLVSNSLFRKVRQTNSEMCLYELYLGTEEGCLHKFDIEKWIQKIKPKANYCERPAFNENKTNMTNFSSELKNIKRINFDQIEPTKIFDNDKMSVFKNNSQELMMNSFCFKVFKEKLAYLAVLAQTEDFIICASKHSNIKIISFKGNLLASLDLDLPFPKKWDFKFELAFHRTAFIQKALEISVKINAKQTKDVTHEIICLKFPESANSNSLFVTEPLKCMNKISSNEQVLTMGQYFTPPAPETLELIEDFTNIRLRKLKNTLDNKRNMKSDIMNYKMLPSNYSYNNLASISGSHIFLPAIKANFKDHSNSFYVKKMENDDKEKMRKFLFEGFVPEHSKKEPQNLQNQESPKTSGMKKTSLNFPQNKQEVKLKLKKFNILNVDLFENIQKLKAQTLNIQQKIKASRFNDDKISSEYKDVKKFVSSLNLKKRNLV